MQPNIFNWMKMSSSHRQFSERNYPTSMAVAKHSRDYSQFVTNVKELQGPQTGSYINEWNHWNASYGKEWARYGGIQQKSMNSAKIVRKKAGIGAIGAAGDLPTDYPSMSAAGWTGCNQPPPGIVKKSGPVTYSGDSAWNVTTYADGSMGTLRYLFLESKSTSDRFWYYPPGIPCGGSVASVTSDTAPYIKRVQAALNEYYLAGGEVPLLVVDGKVGPKTCTVAYSFYSEFLSNTTGVLGPDFFEALYLPREYSDFLGDMCASYHNYQAPIATPEIDEEEEPIIEPHKAGAGTLLAVILIGTAVGMWAFGGKKKR